ncbi:hypothetical protein HU200_029152 [Digitaria exilis]|uniref:Dirigent protein n=1 Tax=Digitaria exilis TaxID=1010633 RepID=A0A835EPA4_9POAL|nr:hypothetical protein HU200_029152 [Digitaria exilis]CAB3489321.1 unnamed protein product [Digitaria exilis]
MAVISSSSFVFCLLAAVVLLAATPAPATAAPWDEKETHIRVYWHDQVTGNATVVTVAEAATTNTSSTRFGAVQVIDDALTLEPNKTVIGRAEGIYVSSNKETTSVTMAMNFVFMDGPYNGSSIAIFGQNRIELKVREMSVIGGSGVFRLARGYVQLRDYWLSPTTGDAIIQYDIYVRHYDH